MPDRIDTKAVLAMYADAVSWITRGYPIMTEWAARQAFLKTHAALAQEIADREADRKEQSELIGAAYAKGCHDGKEANRARVGALEKAGQFKRVEEDDEVVVGDYIFHMERMADDHIWYQIEGQAFDLYVKKGKLCWLPQTPHGWADLGALAAKTPPCDCLPGHVCEVHADREKW